MRAKFINEKFTEDSDPIHDMGIGLLYHKHDFKSYEEMHEWMYEMMPIILNIKNIEQLLPDYPGSYGLNIKYADKYKNYIDTYFTIHGVRPEYYFGIFADYIRKRLNEKKNIKESLNEKFTEEGDPIKQMNIGYSERMLNTMSWKILKFIESKGEEGASLTEIQFYIWTELEGHDEKDFQKRSMTPDISGWRLGNRKTRGHWNTQLYGGPYYHEGLLHKYCEKNPITKKWVLKKFPKPTEKFYSQ